MLCGPPPPSPPCSLAWFSSLGAFFSLLEMHTLGRKLKIWKILFFRIYSMYRKCPDFLAGFLALSENHSSSLDYSEMSEREGGNNPGGGGRRKGGRA